MKILHVVQGYFPALGGTERLIQIVSEKLVANYGDEVTVFTPNGYNCELFWRRDQPELPIGTETLNGVTVRRFGVFNRFNELRRLVAGGSYKLNLPYSDWLRSFYNGPLIPSMTGEIARFDADVVAGSSFPLLHMHYLLRGGKRSGKPVVLHGGLHITDDFGFNRPMIYKAIEQADGYIANTTFERDYLAQEKGIDPNKMRVIGVGVDLVDFEGGNGRNLRTQLNWHTTPIIGFIGQQVPHKGIDLLMNAMETLWQGGAEANLLIAGSQTTYSPTIHQWIAELPDEWRQRVHIINNFDEKEKADLFATVDVVVYPSAHESFGIVYLEAWASRKPVIGARTGATPSVIADEQDGLLIEHRNADDLAQKLARLIADPALRMRLGENGRKKVEQQYTWDIIAEKFRDVYLSVTHQ